MTHTDWQPVSRKGNVLAFLAPAVVVALPTLLFVLWLVQR